MLQADVSMNEPVGAGPLAGLKVIDFSSVMAGPYCTRLLADLGAEVIKVEPLTGDYLRQRSPMRDGCSTYYGQLNAGKKSVVLDLKAPGGLEVAGRLVNVADVLVENFRPGVMARLGLAFEQLRVSNHRLIYCSISGYGQTGPDSAKPAYAPIIQAASGYEIAQMRCQAESEQEAKPQSMGTFAADVIGGTFAFGAIQTALLQRYRTGEGQSIDVSLLESMLNVMVYEVQEALSGRRFSRPVYGPLKCSDGFIVVAPTSQKLFNAFCVAIQRLDLLDDVRFNKVATREANWPAFMEQAQSWAAKRSARECEELLVRAGVPCGRYRSVDEVLADAHIQQRGVLRNISDAAGPFQVTAAPFKFSGARSTPGDVAALGQHTVEVLSSLGYEPGQLNQLRRTGAIS